MKTDEIREKYLDFFVSKGHKLCESDVLVPTWDKSVLFTPAGMNPFKDHFLGNVELEFKRATSCQKCLRTGDIENVGRTAYHHTFFEMLGNFSFGDYFKKDAIHWAWEFLTDKKWLGIDADKLTVTVYLDDDEAADIWHQEIGLEIKRIERLDEYENFWPAGAPSDGPDGVCGPCSEIFYHPQGIGKGGDVEIWNLVFTQFNRSGNPPNNLSPLPSKNIDTGMGLERIAATLQGVNTNFHIDTLRPVVEAASEIAGISYEPDSDTGRFLRRITDHVRACTFSIHENVYPGSSKAEYVVRRLLRRCTLEGRQLGHQEPFLYKLVPAVVAAMSKPYPELAESTDRVQQVIKNEENSFLNKLDEGLVRIDRIFQFMENEKSSLVNGGEAADLYTTYGIPPELVESLSQEKGFQFDWDGFKKVMESHAERSGKIADSVMGDFGPIDEIKKEVKSTTFLGYDVCKSDSLVVGIVAGDQRVEIVEPEAGAVSVVLNQTPFYAESGGQVADKGRLVGPNGEFEVVDVQKNGDVFVHSGRVNAGTIASGDSVKAEVDQEQRQAICRAHSATHILHYALQQTLGSHAQQRGSKVTADLLRFDFSNLEAVSDKDLATIENLTVERIQAGDEIKAEILPLSDARDRGAMMLFGEKYPDPVRMVSIGEFSKELCGGTHLTDSKLVGEFEISVEEGVSSGTRRIEAVTGEKAKQNRIDVIDCLSEISKLLNVKPSNVLDAFDQLLAFNKELKKRINSGNVSLPDEIEWSGGEDLDYLAGRSVIRAIMRTINVSMPDIYSRVEAMLEEKSQLKSKLTEMSNADKVDAESLIDSAKEVSGVKIIAQELSASNPNLMRQLIDQIRKKTSPAAVFLATSPGEDKVILVAGVSHELVEKGIRAGDWVKETAPIVGGGGGGKPDMAQAGGKQPEKIGDAIDAAHHYIQEKLANL
ncbi:MAG: alanine--tRNA ligase [Planctomycetota bacterium]